MEAQELKNKINQVVDQWVSEVLRSRFLEKPTNAKPASLWDKFKQGVTNWWWGPKGDEYNSYRWKNRFGSELGVAESFDPSAFTLQEYSRIKGLVDLMEAEMKKPDEGFDKLRLMTIVRSAAQKLKQMLFDALSGRMSAAAPSAGTEPRDKTVRATAPVEDPNAQRLLTPRAVVVANDKDRPASDADSPMSPEGAEDAAEADAGGGAVLSRTRKTDKQKIEDAAQEALEASDEDLKPNLSWLHLSSGVLKRERIPYLLKWMHKKTHIHSLDDKAIKEELKEEMKREVDLGIGKEPNLKAYLIKRLGVEAFNALMEKLDMGSERISVEQEAEAGGSRRKKSKKAEKAVENPPPPESNPEGRQTSSIEEPVDQAGGRGQESPQNEDLKGYLYDGESPRSVKTAIGLIFGFVNKIAHELGKKDEVKKWWDAEGSRLKAMPNNDRFEHLEASLLKSDEYLASIAKAVGINASDLKENMSNFLREKGDDKKPEQPASDDEIDDSLDLDSYIKTEGTMNSLDESMRRLGRFMSNPLALTGVKPDDKRIEAVRGWWGEEKETIGSKSDPMEYIGRKLLSGDWVKEIGDMLGKSSDFVKNLMLHHIRRRSNR